MLNLGQVWAQNLFLTRFNIGTYLKKIKMMFLKFFHIVPKDMIQAQIVLEGFCPTNFGNKGLKGKIWVLSLELVEKVYC